MDDLGPDRIVSELATLTGETPAQALLPHLIMPAHHDVRSSDVFTRRLHSTLAAAAERGPVDFPDLLLTPGVGGRTVRSLAMVAEVVHGAPFRFDIESLELTFGGNFALDNLGRALARGNLKWYERHAAWVFPALAIRYRLRAVK